MLTKEYLDDFICKQKAAIVTSVDEEGFPNTKAMFVPRKIEGNCYYFTTNTSSKRAGQFMKNPKSSIYFFNKGRFKYEGVMLIGIMEVLLDADIKKDIWRTGDTMYYPGGVTDPDYCVFRFTALKGRHYCNLKNEDFIMDDLK